MSTPQTSIAAPPPGPGAVESRLLRFEADFVNSLRCIPMIVRLKLSLCGIDLSLRAWGQLSISTRARLVQMPVSQPDELAGYRQFLCDALENAAVPVVERDVDPPLWMRSDAVPDDVAGKAGALGVGEAVALRWPQLDPLQRFALVKLTQGEHEDGGFLSALREFGLAG